VGELTNHLRAFLGERRYAVLATHDPDGGIHLTPIWFLFADDRFYFASYDSAVTRPFGLSAVGAGAEGSPSR